LVESPGTLVAIEVDMNEKAANGTRSMLSTEMAVIGVAPDVHLYSQSNCRKWRKRGRGKMSDCLRRHSSTPHMTHIDQVYVSSVYGIFL
jgi:hypothetical protein